MQDIITRAIEAEAKLLTVPFTGPALAAASWLVAVQTARLATGSDTATTGELLAEAEGFDPTEKHYPIRAQLQFARLAKAWREGR